MTDHKHKWKYKHKDSKKTGVTLIVERFCSCGADQWGTIEKWSRVRMLPVEPPRALDK